MSFRLCIMFLWAGATYSVCGMTRVCWEDIAIGMSDMGDDSEQLEPKDIQLTLKGLSVCATHTDFPGDLSLWL